MAKNPDRATESKISMGVLRVAASEPNGVATFHKLRKEIPNIVTLTDEDRAASLTRNGEELWEQIMRNIKSHSETEGNIICEGYAEHIPRVGYRITDSGRRYLANKGY